QVVVGPILKRIGRGRTAAFFNRAVVGAAGIVIVALVGRSPGNVNPAAVGFPPGHTRGKVLVGVSEALVVVFLVLIEGRLRIGVAPLPEALDEGLALILIAELQKGLALLRSDDVGYVLVEPLLVFGVQLLLQLLLLLPPLFGGEGVLRRRRRR